MQINSTLTNGIAALPPSTSPYYFIAWATTTANGVTSNSLMGFGYVKSSTGGTKTKWNLIGFTTFAECQAYATGESLTGLPAKDPAPS